MASAEVVDCAYNLAGGVSVYQTSNLQRHFRDIHVATQHYGGTKHRAKPRADCSPVCLPFPTNTLRAPGLTENPRHHFYRGAGNELIASNEDNCLGYFVSGTRARD